MPVGIVLNELKGVILGTTADSNVMASSFLMRMQLTYIRVVILIIGRSACAHSQWEFKSGKELLQLVTSSSRALQ